MTYLMLLLQYFPAETEENDEQAITFGRLVNNKPSISKHSVVNYCYTNLQKCQYFYSSAYNE